MNYRHAFHAGGFADVIKHIVLVRILTYLQQKASPFLFFVFFVCVGFYDLNFVVVFCFFLFFFVFV